MIRAFAVLHLLTLVSSDALAQGSNDVVRICIAPAAVEASAGDAEILAGAVRETFTQFLTGPTLRATALDAPLQSQARLEAESAGCPFILFTTVRHIRDGGGSGFLGRAIGGAVQSGALTAGAATGSVAGVVAGSAIAGAAGAAALELSWLVKTRDEIALSYQFESASGNVLVKKSDKRKAKSDGEDLLTPMAGKAAEAIAAAAAKQRR